MTALIGSWTARFAGDRQVTLWHQVESQVADRLVTHCGRELHSKTAKGRLVIRELGEGDVVCLGCSWLAR